MASVKVKFRKSSIKGYKGSCYIQVIHNRSVKTLTIDAKLLDKEWNSQEGCIIMDDASRDRQVELLLIQNRIDRAIRNVNAIIDKLENKLEPYSVKDIIDGYNNIGLRDSFFALMSKRIEYLELHMKKSTADNCRCALSSFKQFRKDKDIRLGDITSSVIMEYESYLKARKLCRNTTSFYMRTLRACYNYGVDEKELIPTNKFPFRKVFTGEEKTLKRAVKGNVIQELMRLDLSRKPLLELARDMFLFSIYLQGMPFVDIAHLTQRNIKGGYLTYQRQKTEYRLQIRLLDCAQAIIDKYKMITEDTDLIFPLLYHPGKNKFTSYGSALRTYNRRLHELSNMLELDIPLSSYVARHTWATLAKWAGVPESVISEAMGHTSEETTKIYLDSFNIDVMDGANLKVASIFNRQT